MIEIFLDWTEKLKQLNAEYLETLERIFLSMKKKKKIIINEQDLVFLEVTILLNIKVMAIEKHNHLKNIFIKLANL